MKPKQNQVGDIYKPTAMDSCQTPDYALYPLLPYLRDEWVIWEPAAGEGHMANNLRKRNYRVISTDILIGCNFFEGKPFEWDCQITNPPYSIKYPWLQRSYELGKPFALLLPVETVGAKKAQLLFRLYGIEIIFFNPRINFKMPNKGYSGGGAQFPTAWFTWKFNIGQQISFVNIPKEIIQRGY